MYPCLFRKWMHHPSHPCNTEEMSVMTAPHHSEPSASEATSHPAVEPSHQSFVTTSAMVMDLSFPKFSDASSEVDWTDWGDPPNSGSPSPSTVWDRAYFSQTSSGVPEPRDQQTPPWPPSISAMLKFVQVFAGERLVSLFSIYHTSATTWSTLITTQAYLGRAVLDFVLSRIMLKMGWDTHMSFMWQLPWLHERRDAEQLLYSFMQWVGVTSKLALNDMSASQSFAIILIDQTYKVRWLKKKVSSAQNEGEKH